MRFKFGGAGVYPIEVCGHTERLTLRAYLHFIHADQLGDIGIAEAVALQLAEVRCVKPL